MYKIVKKVYIALLTSVIENVKRVKFGLDYLLPKLQLSFGIKIVFELYGA